MTMIAILRRAAIWAGVALAALGLSAAAFAQKTKLTVYTAIENEQLEPFKKAFEADNPTIEIAWVRDSTGVVTAKLIAEKDNPRADVIWGLAASSVGLFASLGMIEPYTPAGAAALKPMFKSGKKPGDLGRHGRLSSPCVCFNTAEAEKNKKPKPTSWADLTKPDYKDSIVMPNPASSGTGYLTVAGWLTIMGEEAGWKFMDALHQNVAQYLHSGSAPCVQAAKGERLIGIGFDMRGATEKTKGAPIDLIVPKEGLGWEMEVTAIMKGTKNLEAAKKLADWSSSLKANELYGKYYAIVANPHGQVDAGQLSGRRREADGQDGRRMDGQEPRSHPRRMDQALRRQVGAEGQVTDSPERGRASAVTKPYLEVRNLSASASATSPPSATSLSTSPRASSSASSGPRAAARRPCCAPSPASIRRPPARSARRGGTSRRCRRPSATSASSSSPTRCFPISPSPTMSATGW